ncbi:hypothetical protein GCM10009555_106900 [Acrocarpospora macrocephala]|uniref:Uncharacterized protein n=1 Tax=Acrocarpospora macrocephala TaxID=150177 RepID=A0A5M3X320_9ACTN|nr:hypothetical protein Amac_085990 [Acrocarpospora macrocephala]
MPPEEPFEAFQSKSDRLAEFIGSRWQDTTVSTHVFFVHIDPGKDISTGGGQTALPREQVTSSPLYAQAKSMKCARQSDFAVGR